MNAETSEHAVAVIVVFAFIRRNGEILLIERALPPYAGTKTIPGGHKRPGEELRAACAREMEEETGLAPADLRFAGIMQVRRPSGPEHLCVYFIADSFTGEVRAGREGELAWVKAGEVAGLPEAHPALRALFPFILDNDYPVTAEAFCDEEGRGVYRIAGRGEKVLMEKHYG